MASGVPRGSGLGPQLFIHLFITLPIFRVALKYNLTVMNFLENYPKPRQHFPVHKLDILQNYKAPIFDFVMEHIYYDSKKLDNLMPGNKTFISGLRYPFSQLKSDVHYKSLDKRKKLRGGFENIFEKYLATGKIKLPGQQYIKIPEEFYGNSEKLEKYFNILEKEFSFIMITEYYDASLVLLKRILCWDLEDIVYSRLKKGKYVYTNTTLLERTEKLHKELKPEEYALYEHFNRTFWSHVSKQTSDFWDEVQLYQTIVKNVSQFCETFYKRVQQKQKEVFKIILEEKTPFRVLRSRWNKPFVIDAEDCLLMKVEKRFFRNVNILKNFPHLCHKVRKIPSHFPRNLKARRKIEADEMMLRKRKGSPMLIFDPMYCFPSNMSKYNLPLDVLTNKAVWDWDDSFSSKNRKSYNDKDHSSQDTLSWKFRHHHTNA